MGLSEANLTATLDRLVHAGLLFCRGAGSEATYTFKHSLCQEAAYGALLREKRRDLHTRIADALEQEAPEPTAIQLDTIARHQAEAGFPEKSAAALAHAGRLALGRTEIVEAEAQLKRALALTDSASATPQMRKLRRAVKSDLAKIKTLLNAGRRDQPGGRS